MKTKILKFMSDGSIKEIFSFEKTTDVKRFLLGTDIEAGFPSPAQDYIEQSLDLNEFLIKNKSATFFVRVEGYSMINAGIHPEDILIVDRAMEVKDGKVIIAVVDGEFTVKRLKIIKNKWFLIPENPDFDEIQITESHDFSVWGIVTNVIHKV